MTTSNPNTPIFVDAGQFRERICIQEPIDTINASAGSTRSWQTVTGCDSVPAMIVYPPPSKKGDEFFTQQQVRSSVFATITIRYRPGQNISAAMKVVYGIREFNIRTVIPDDQYKKTITLQCEELQGKGSLH
jgi:SPP1 family predicted phage head-tail adaptor